MQASQRVVNAISEQCDKRTLLAFLFAGMHEDGQELLGEGTLRDKTKLVVLLFAKILAVLREEGHDDAIIEAAVHSIVDDAIQTSLRWVE